MTALRAPVRPVVVILPRPGWCTPCAAADRQRPAADPRSGLACRDHLRLLPARPPTPGQLALVDAVPVPRLLQADHPTGLQVPCSPCAAAGRDGLGLPYRFAEDPTPLCLECWRRRERQAGRRGRARDDDEPIEWVQELPAGCAACGEPDPSPACWLCGYSWLADARAAYERQQAEDDERQEAEQAAIDAQFAQVAARAQAADRVVWLTGWVGRLRDVLAAYADPGRRGSAVSERWGRAVELLADALARDVEQRTDPRGRPSAFRMVAAVMAVDADYRSGRRAMPGRAECAELAGYCERAVSTAWKRGVTIGAWIRTTKGRRLTLAERMELQRGNDRAVYDLRPVNRSTNPAVREAMVPAALAALDELLEWGMRLLVDAEHDLDRLDAPAGRTGRAPDADTIAQRAARARLRQIVARTRTAATVLASHLTTGYMCTPHTVSKGECVSSCLRGRSKKALVICSPVHTRQRPRRGRGKSDIGASRSPTKSGSADLERGGSVVGRPDGTHPASRPRTPYTVDGTSPAKHKKPRKRAEWADWAYPLAFELRKLWTWLRYQDIHQVAGALGKRLGDRWTAAAVVDFVDQARDGWALPVEKHSPVSLLIDLLEHALTGELQPPFPARRRDEHLRDLARQRRAAVAAAAEAARIAAAAARAEQADQAAAAAAERGGARTGLAAARAAVNASRSRPKPTRAVDPDHAARMAEARAEIAQHGARGGADEPVEAWPDTNQAGSGLPQGWRRGDG